MNTSEQVLMAEIRGHGAIVRTLMGKDEIKIAERMVKAGLLRKGVSDDRQHSVQFTLAELEA